MRKLLVAISVIIVLAIAFATSLLANKGDENYLAEKNSASPESSPSASAAPSTPPSSTPSNEPIISEEPSPSVTPDSGPMNPLTGLPVDEECAAIRPYAIMINNISVAQPQLGISKADIIYEILVEGGITRMMAIFQDVTGAGEIGSIRSARPYFVDIAYGYDAVYIHAGGSPDAYTELKSTAITSFDGVNGKKQDIFYRDKDRKSQMGLEHSLVTTSDLIEKYMPTYDIRLFHNDDYTCNMIFGDDAVPISTETADKVVVHFSSSKTTTFDYSADEGLYSISQYKEAYVDGDNNEVISVKNVVVVITDINVIAGDDKGRIDVAVSGSGTGIFINGGKYETIKWSRKSSTSQYVFTHADGSPLVFGRGKTFVCVIDEGNAIDIT